VKFLPWAEGHFACACNYQFAKVITLMSPEPGGILLLSLIMFNLINCSKIWMVWKLKSWTGPSVYSGNELFALLLQFGLDFLLCVKIEYLIVFRSFVRVVEWPSSLFDIISSHWIYVEGIIDLLISENLCAWTLSWDYFILVIIFLSI